MRGNDFLERFAPRIRVVYDNLSNSQHLSLIEKKVIVALEAATLNKRNETCPKLLIGDKNVPERDGKETGILFFPSSHFVRES